MDEIWKDIVGYEGLYQVSNMGRVRSKERILKVKGLEDIKEMPKFYRLASIVKDI